MKAASKRRGNRQRRRLLCELRLVRRALPLTIAGSSPENVTLRSVAIFVETVKPRAEKQDWGSRRRTRTRKRVLRAAGQILERYGYARLTMERVAEESGVAKTTLYRRWPNKAALCMELYLEVASRELRAPDTGDIARDLKQIFVTVVHLQTETVAGPALLGLIAEAQIRPKTRKPFLAEFARRRREVTRLVLRRAIERGELRPDTDIDLVIDALGGAATFRLLQGHAPLSTKLADGLVSLVLDGCRARSVRAR
jgi:AcrR family transcriptional regulator